MEQLIPFILGGVLVLAAWLLGRRDARSALSALTSRIQIAEQQHQLFVSRVDAWMKETGEEVGHIYAHMQKHDQDFQRKAKDDIDKFTKEMAASMGVDVASLRKHMSQERPVRQGSGSL